MLSEVLEKYHIPYHPSEVSGHAENLILNLCAVFENENTKLKDAIEEAHKGKRQHSDSEDKYILNDRIKTLQMELNEKSKEVEKFKQHHPRVRFLPKLEAKAQLADADEPIYDIIQKLTLRRQEQEGELFNLKQKHQELNEQIEHQTKELFMCQQELKDAYIRIDYNNQYIQFLKEQYQSMNKGKSENEEEGMNSNQVKLQQILNAYDLLSNNMLQLKESYTLMLAHVEDQDKTIEQKKLEHEKLYLEYNELKTENSFIKERANFFSDQIEILSEQLEREKKANQQSTNDKNYLDSLLSEKQNVIQALDYQLSKKNEDWDALQNAYTNCIHENKKLESDISYYKKEMEKLSKNYFGTTMTNQLSLKEVEDYKDLIRKYEESFNKMESEINDLKIQLSLRDSTIKHLNDEKEIIEKKVSISRAVSEQEKASSEQVERLSNLIKQKETTINQLNVKIMKLNQEIENEKMKNSSLRDNIARKTDAEKEKNIQYLKNQLNIIKNENDALKDVIRNMEKIMHESSPESTGRIHLKSKGSGTTTNPLLTPTQPVLSTTTTTTIKPMHATDIHDASPIASTPRIGTGPNFISTNDEGDDELSQNLLQEWKAHSNEFLQQLNELKERRKEYKESNAHLSSMERLNGMIQEENKLLKNIFEKVKQDLEKATSKSPLRENDFTENFMTPYSIKNESDKSNFTSKKTFNEQTTY